jgi:hypothetical protein
MQVVVRCRPLDSKERAEGRKQIVEMDVREGQVRVRNPKADASDTPKTFTYDQVYDINSQQLEIFSITAKPIVDSVMAGYNGTIFAYGQTGTGGALLDSSRAHPNNHCFLMTVLSAMKPQQCDCLVGHETPTKQQAGTPKYSALACRQDVHNGGSRRCGHARLTRHHAQRL